MSQNSQTQQKIEQKQQSNLKFWVIGIVIVLVMAVFAFWSLAYLPGQAQKTIAQAFQEDLGAAAAKVKVGGGAMQILQEEVTGLYLKLDFDGEEALFSQLEAEWLEPGDIYAKLNHGNSTYMATDHQPPDKLVLVLDEEACARYFAAAVGSLGSFSELEAELDEEAGILLRGKAEIYGSIRSFEALVEPRIDETLRLGGTLISLMVDGVDLTEDFRILVGNYAFEPWVLGYTWRVDIVGLTIEDRLLTLNTVPFGADVARGNYLTFNTEDPRARRGSCVVVPDFDPNKYDKLRQEQEL